MHPIARGITLIELMIVVAIVAILAGVAYPSYQEHVRKARRADAQTALLELAQFMERYYTTNGRYLNVDDVPPDLPFDEAPKDGASKYYDLQYSGGETATVYTLQAEPKGAMSGDACGTMTVTQTGAKGASRDDCWRR